MQHKKKDEKVDYAIHAANKAKKKGGVVQVEVKRFQEDPKIVNEKVAAELVEMKKQNVKGKARTKPKTDREHRARKQEQRARRRNSRCRGQSWDILIPMGKRRAGSANTPRRSNFA